MPVLSALAEYNRLDLTQALKEGWCIDYVPGFEGGPFQLVKVDCPEEHSPPLPAHNFDGDENAQSHVVARALDGSEYHQKALGFLRSHGPDEWQAIAAAHPKLAHIPTISA